MKRSKPLPLLFLALLTLFFTGCDLNSAGNKNGKNDKQSSGNAERKEIAEIDRQQNQDGLRQVEELNLYSSEAKIFTSMEDALQDPENVTRLRLNARHLQQIPPQVLSFSNLRELYLQENQLTNLPDSFGLKLPKLEILDLRDNRLFVFPVQLLQLRNLQYLNLSENQIAFFPKDFAALQNLQILDIRGNRFAKIPPPVFQLKNLKYFFARGIPLDNFPTEMQQLNKLQLLHLDNCRLRVFPQSILQLKKLERLVLSQNQLTLLPQGLDQLALLSHLNLSKNKISELQVLSGLRSLRNLNLSRNPVKVLPEILFDKLTRLKALDISYTGLDQVPPQIGKLRELVWLVLQGLPIQMIPDELKKCQQLQYLALGNHPQLNLEQTIDQLVFFPKLYYLRIQSLRGNLLSLPLPEKIIALKQVKFLDLKGNRLQNAPQAIDALAEMPSLEALNLSQCGIRQALPAFGKLTSLKKIGLDIQNMYAREIQKLPAMLPNTSIVDGSDYFDLKF